MVQDMNQDTDPCKDFFQYACGGYIQRNTKYGHSYYASKISSVQKKNYLIAKAAIESIDEETNKNDPLVKAAKYYSSCMRNDGSRGLYAYWQALEDIGGAPIVDSHWSTTSGLSWNVVTTLQKLHLSYGTYPLFQVTVTPNLKNTNQHIFVVGSMR